MNLPQWQFHTRMGWLAWLLMSLASFAVVVNSVVAFSAPTSVDVVVRMSKTTGGNIQLFAGTGTGYQEMHSVTLSSAADGAIHAYALRVSDPAALRAFRIDPGSGAGRVVLDRVDIISPAGSIRLEGSSLRQATTPLNELLAEPAEGEISFQSLGSDPYLEVALPDSLLREHNRLQRRHLLLSSGGAAALLLLLWIGRAKSCAFVAGIRQHRMLAIFPLTVVLALATLAPLGTGCDGWCSADGARYGAALLLGSLAMAVVGAAVMRITGLEAHSRGLRLFLWIIVGQTVLVVYVFLRSALHAAIPMLPLGATELGLLVLGAAGYVYTTRSRSTAGTVAAPRHLAWVGIELGLLVAVCLVVADRELPRWIMLSSDPDTHAYFSRQVDLLGGIPWKGEAVFNYPAGTAAMSYLWAKLALLDVRNAMTALPLLQSFLAALMLGEALASRIARRADRLLLMLTALGVTAAGFLIPLFANYSHMEGTGRQLAIATSALVPALLLSSRTPRAGADRAMAAILLAALFTLAALNPVSIVVPVVLAIAYAIHVAVARQRILGWWLAALLGLPLALLLDPYYFQLITGGAPPPKITINSAMHAKSVPDILSAWQNHHVTRPWDFLAGWLTMARGHAAPMFAILLGALLGLRLLLHRSIRINRSTLIAIGLAVLALGAADGLFTALADDRRFYLLAPYHAFTLAQLKMLLLTVLASSVILAGSLKSLRSWLLACLGSIMVLMVYQGMHGTQKYVLEPRVGYCGSLGCLSPDDLKVMRDMEQMHLGRNAAPETAASLRVLVPNSVHDTQNEDWVFPIAGARALPFYDVPPVAFFYYQGDDDYTTENYKTHVCRQLDRGWLRQQRIVYVFLPSVRGSACMKDMERLPETEDVLIKHGNSYLLRLR